MKMMALQTNEPIDLVKKLSAIVPTETIYNTVSTHDVTTAEAILSDIYKALPLYDSKENPFTAKVGGGGGGTYNPFFFEQSARLFVEANGAGITFPDDLTWNWGLYEDYEPKHHAYWGLQSAMAGTLDNLIFPQNAVLSNIVPESSIQKTPIYTHPTVGGKRKYTTPGAIRWLA
jgi:hypothetical protein